MKQTLVLIIVVSVGLLAYLLFSKDATITNYPPKEGSIVAFGDSLIKGVGAGESENFIALLSKKIGEPIVNLGVPGNTTVDGLARINEVLEEEPRIVILLLGGNDYLKKIPKEETFANLKAVITTLHKEGVLVVLLGVRGGVLNDRFEENFEQLAEETGVAFVPDVLDGIFGKSSLMSDAIHPNKEGYAIIADRVYEVIKTVLH